MSKSFGVLSLFLTRLASVAKVTLLGTSFFNFFKFFLKNVLYSCVSFITRMKSACANGDSSSTEPRDCLPERANSTSSNWASRHTSLSVLLAAWIILFTPTNNFSELTGPELTNWSNSFASGLWNTASMRAQDSEDTFGGLETEKTGPTSESLPPLA